MNSYQRFFAELKRRQVFKVIWWYGMVGFGVLQAADIALPRLGLPDWTVTFMLAVVLLAFPVAVMLAWAFEVTPAGVRRAEEASPEEIAAIVDAPASARWPSGLLALIGVLALVGSTWWLARRTAPVESGTSAAESADPRLQLALAGDPTDDRPSLAVLPFADMSPEGDQAYFSDGITEEILNTLARVRELKVAARTSAFAFKGRQLDLRAVGDSLGVAFLIEGSVRKSGDRLRITAQLIDAADGSHLWSDSYDRTMDDVFAIQTEIAEAIAAELRVPLGLDDPSELVTPTADLEAYDLYLAGRARIRERGASLREAVRLFEAAIARDSTWAPAWAALAEAHELRSWYPAAWDEEPEDDDAYNATVARHHAAAEVAAQRALTIDPDIPTARVALGSVYRNRRQWEASEREYLRALAIDPDNAEAHQQYSEMLGDVGQIDRAVAAAERAVRLDPAPIRRLQYGAVLWADDRPTEAKRQLREGIDLDPENHVPQLRSSLYLMELSSGDHDELAAFDLPPDLPVTPEQHARLVQAMRTGDKSLIPSEFAETPQGTAPQVAVWTWASFGDRERALEAIERRLVESPAGVLVWLWNPNLDPLREDPRFREILERVDLGGATPQRTPR